MARPLRIEIAGGRYLVMGRGSERSRGITKTTYRWEEFHRPRQLTLESVSPDAHETVPTPIQAMATVVVCPCAPCVASWSNARANRVQLKVGEMWILCESLNG